MADQPGSKEMLPGNSTQNLFKPMIFEMWQLDSINDFFFVGGGGGQGLIWLAVQVGSCLHTNTLTVV